VSDVIFEGEGETFRPSEVPVMTRPTRGPDKAPRKVKRGAVVRRAAPRQSEDRQAHDTARAGVGQDPGPIGKAEPAREAVTFEEPIRRVSRGDRQDKSFDIPSHRKRQGWDYEFKTIRVLGQPVDAADLLDVRQGGWRPEIAKDWPELVDVGVSPDSPVERYGQRLYGRPMNLTIEARREDLQYAQEQQRDRTLAAASGRSAVRGEEGIPTHRGTRAVPVEMQIEGLMG